MAKAAGRKVSRSEAAGLLEAWKLSGAKLSHWCAERGLNWYSLNAHKGRLPASTEVGFVELTTALEPVARYRVELGDVIVEVDDHFRADTLRRLVEVVSTC